VKNCISGKAEIVLNPSIPSEWNEYSIKYKYKSSIYFITINKKARFPKTISLIDDGKEHDILINK
jgi:cellobiose phosphorylase